MIYTVGNTEQYEAYLAVDTPIKKKRGGSVWQTCLSTMMYLYKTKQFDLYTVYGVEADWNTCHRLGHKTYRALRKDSPIVRVEEDIYEEARQAILTLDALSAFMALSPWIVRVTYDDEDKPVRIYYCRFCAGKKPHHFGSKDYTGPPCPLLKGQQVIYNGPKKGSPEKDAREHSEEVDQEAS